jgi:3-oxoacyl-[acyl-carrier-protein] synthase II
MQRGGAEMMHDAFHMVMERRDHAHKTGRKEPIEVAVTGLGASTPLGGTVGSTWSALLDGQSGVAALEDEWASPLPVRIAARLRVDPREVLGRVEARRLDRSQQIALVAAREAWAHANAPDVEPDRLAVVIGTGIGGIHTILDQDAVLSAKGPRGMSPFTIPMLMPNGAAAAVSLDLGARGGAHAPVSACASGAEAIAVGLALIRSGRADVVIAGGTDACILPLSLAGFAQMSALSKRNDDPRAASRPFDLRRDGFVMGEGAGILVLERADFARARKAAVLGILAGAGVTSDAHHITTPSPDGQVRAIREALAASGLGPTDITHVNAHATSTPVGDAVEAAAIVTAIGLHPTITAVKSMTGHLLGAAGAVEAIVTLLTMREGLIPATLNLSDQDPDVKLEVISGQPRYADTEAAISDSFGFGGHNVALAFTRSVDRPADCTMPLATRTGRYSRPWVVIPPPVFSTTSQWGARVGIHA